MNISEATLYRWKQQHGTLELSEVKELNALREANARLRRVVADQALNTQMLKEVNAKIGLARRKSATLPKAWSRRASVPGVRRAATLGWLALGARTAPCRRRSAGCGREQPRRALPSLPRYGYRRIHALVERHGHRCARRTAQRVRRQERLRVPAPSRRPRCPPRPEAKIRPEGVNHV